MALLPVCYEGRLRVGDMNKPTSIAWPWTWPYHSWNTSILVFPRSAFSPPTHPLKREKKIRFSNGSKKMGRVGFLLLLLFLDMIHIWRFSLGFCFWNEVLKCELGYGVTARKIQQRAKGREQRSWSLWLQNTRERDAKFPVAVLFFQTHLSETSHACQQWVNWFCNFR